MAATAGFGPGQGPPVIEGGDGAAAAPAGPPQMPLLLRGYRFRPSWKVAGVDFRVGIPAGMVLSDWKTLDAPGVKVEANSISIDAKSFVLNGVDFSTHGGATVAVCASATGIIQNCRFGGPRLKTINTGIIDASSLTLCVRNCEFDGQGAGSAACILFIRSAANTALLYNHFHNFPTRVVQMLAGGALDYRFNLIGLGAMDAAAHLNYLEFGRGAATVIAAFNTTAQTARAPSGGEGFQFYFGLGGRIRSPVCARNTMIARGGGAETVMSYMLHGSVYKDGIETVLEGEGLVSENYFDISSAYGAFYGGSFPGWRFERNIDMASGRTLPGPR